MMSFRIESAARRRLGQLAVLVIAAVAAACGGTTGNNNSGLPAHVTMVAGTDLSATVGTDLGPIVARVTDTAGDVAPNITVNFSVTGDATLSHTSAVTSSSGDAVTSITFGHTAGPVTVTASVAGITETATAHETGLPLEASVLTISQGNHQSGTAGTQLGDLLAVSVTDAYGNPISGVTLTYTASAGVLANASPRTDATGIASTVFTLPGTPGPVTITASALLNGGTTTVTFTETAN